MIDVTRLRADTPGTDHVVHLNNAGAALMPQPVIDAMLGYLEYEVTHGVYLGDQTCFCLLGSRDQEYFVLDHVRQIQFAQQQAKSRSERNTSQRLSDGYVRRDSNVFQGSRVEFDFDFVLVFQAGEYEDRIANNSVWETGDWNGDGDFDSSDFVVAFQSNGFENGPRAAMNVVPEPSNSGLLFLMLNHGIRKQSMHYVL